MNHDSLSLVFLSMTNLLLRGCALPSQAAVGRWLGSYCRSELSVSSSALQAHAFASQAIKAKSGEDVLVLEPRPQLRGHIAFNSYVCLA